MLRIGVIGTAQSGKTTVYNAVAAAHADVGAYLGREEVRRTMVKVPDVRLDRLFDLFVPPKKIHAEIEYFDFPALTGDAAEVTLLPPALRELDALIVVLREFGSAADPGRDWRGICDELILADLMIVEKRMSRLHKEVETGRTENKPEYDALARCRVALEEGQPVRHITMTLTEQKLLRGYGFLSGMAVLALINAPDEGSARTEESWQESLAPGPKSMVRVLRGKLESELSGLDPADRAAFMADYGLATSALDGMIASCYSLLGLITFFTGGSEKDVHAWTVRRGALAPEAAGVIHSDFEQGFIRAEVTPVEDLLNLGSLAAAKKVGKSRLEGKEYVVHDGDYILFRFNV
ncbi:MAG: redox-regulated ATPase YchF [candidate division Zixibacteria bacterium]|nr:redox-regulated ATPase YchF [candidate division Zixibacteria bacterium]